MRYSVTTALTVRKTQFMNTFILHVGRTTQYKQATHTHTQTQTHTHARTHARTHTKTVNIGRQ